MSFSIFPVAYAANSASTAGHSGGMGGMGMILLWVGLLVILYFLMWRPQSKRMKEQKKMLSELAKDDEVVTNGGVLGRIITVKNDYIILMIAKGINICIQKQAVAVVLPKGTMDSIE